MNRRLAVVLLLIVLLPLALLTWLGQRVARTEEDRIAQRFGRLLEQRLAGVNAQMQVFVAAHERDLLELTSSLPRDPDELRRIAREDSRVASVFRLSAQGDLEYPVPSPDRPLTRAEASFLRRTDLIWRDRELLHMSGSGDTANYSSNRAPAQARSSSSDVVNYRSAATQTAEAERDYGWYAWHFEHGLHLLFWRRLPNGEFLGAELDRSRFMNDLISALPATLNDETDALERTMLLSADGDVIYQWGGYEPAKDDTARIVYETSAPLNSWRLAWYGPLAGAGEGFSGYQFSMFGGIGALAVALGLLAVYFYRESSRELREAGQRVNFVGQVSHELKTPLTNIRMYAELLEQELEEDDEEARKDLDVIVSESRRLSRLIGNILTFSRRDREVLRLRLSPGDLDETVRNTIDHFRPLLESKGVEIELEPAVGGEVAFDRDVVEQILGNLLSNVEKYGASGGRLKVTTRREGSRSVITVADEGPGVPQGEREKIFEPFYRVSDRLTDGVTGTGLGLSLSRELARLHGGDLKLVESEKGACFEISIDHSIRQEAAAE